MTTIGPLRDRRDEAAHLHPDERGFNSRLLIDATKPWEWRERFAEPVVTAEMTRAAREKWGWILDPSAPDPRQ